MGDEFFFSGITWVLGPLCTWIIIVKPLFTVCPNWKFHVKEITMEVMNTILHKLWWHGSLWITTLTHVFHFQGVVRIHFIEAQDLEGKDTYLKGIVKGKSDPYGIIRVGNQIFQSKVIKENLNPKWNEVYEV